MKTSGLVEVLEPRVAPAIIFTYTDVDGDLVTVAISKGNPGDAVFTHPPVTGTFGDQLQSIDLMGNHVFDGASITVTAKPQKLLGSLHGDGLANVGFIDASGGGGINLGSVSISGDLGKILAGNGTGLGVKSLNALSLGRFDTTTGAPDLLTAIQGKLGTLTMKSDLLGAVSATSLGTVKIGGNVFGTLDTTGGGIGSVTIAGDFSGIIRSDAKLGGVSIGGSFLAAPDSQNGVITSDGDMGLIKIRGDFRPEATSGGIISSQGKLAGVNIGGSFIALLGAFNGTIASEGDMGMVKIGGDLRGAATNSAIISSESKIAGVNIGGSIIGGAALSAVIFSSDDMGPVKVGGNISGGFGDRSGMIESSTKISSVTVGGSVIGGSGNNTGEIISGRDIGSITIRGDLRGGAVSPRVADSLDSSGYIEGTRIGSIFIGGSIIQGSSLLSTAPLTKNASIRAADNIGSITVVGNLVGNGAGSEVIISARGQRDASLTSNSDVAIGKISIGGRVEFANILAGYDTALTAVNADAQISSVSVRGDWISSNLIAGVSSGGDTFGNANDAKPAGPGVKDGAAISRIAKVIIGGNAIGTIAANDAATFGIEAEELVSIRTAGATVPLRSGASNDLIATALPLGPTLGTIGDGFDFHAFEVP